VIWVRARRLLRWVIARSVAWARRLDAYLAAAEQRAHATAPTTVTDGPPAHWVERVSRGAPHLLDPSLGAPDASAEPPLAPFATAGASPLIAADGGEDVTWPSSASTERRREPEHPLRPPAWWRQRPTTRVQKASTTPVQKASTTPVRSEPSRPSSRGSGADVASDDPRKLPRAAPGEDEVADADPAGSRDAADAPAWPAPPADRGSAASTRGAGAPVSPRPAPPAYADPTPAAPPFEARRVRAADSPSTPSRWPSRVTSGRESADTAEFTALPDAAADVRGRWPSLSHADDSWPRFTPDAPRRRDDSFGSPGVGLDHASADVTLAAVDSPTWPSLPDEREAVDDRANALREWERQQRLDAEQRGRI
jgi:hypothetical protein